MTLWELMESLNVRLLCPQTVGELRILNLHEFCRMKIRTYMVQDSVRFQNDLEDCVNDLDETVSLGQTPTLIFKKNEDLSITLKITNSGE